MRAGSPHSQRARLRRIHNDTGEIQAREEEGLAKRIRSGLKRLRQNARRTLRNRVAKSKVKTLTKRARTSAGQAAVTAAVKALDKAAAKGILHKNTAARRKSRLVKAARSV
jgi:small subunit ribosomal protein S20